MVPSGRTDQSALTLLSAAVLMADGQIHAIAPLAGNVRYGFAVPPAPKTNHPL